MPVLQPILDAVSVCVSHGVTLAVISPGSRSAALSLAFERHPEVKTTIAIDERTGGFLALGMAQQTRKAVALVCTSGSAGYNYAPAVVEAFFQHIPLLVLTADRPPEWIGQQDGQTIYQHELFGKHCKASYSFPVDVQHPDTEWYANRILNEAILTAERYPQGPVHINIPIREPFYPMAEEPFVFSSKRKLTVFVGDKKLTVNQWHTLQDSWESAERILIAVGQHSPSPELTEILMRMSEEWHIPVVSEAIGNVRGEGVISHQDFILANTANPKFVPDLLITIGESFISKNLKKYFRVHQPAQHWHVDASEAWVDTLQTLTTSIQVEPVYFFQTLFEDLDYQHFTSGDEPTVDSGFQEYWQGAARVVKTRLHSFFNTYHTWSELRAVFWLLEQLPAYAQLQVANSLSVRYVNMFGSQLKETVEVFANRGTSGIDGCVSTAMGAAMVSATPVYLLVGDVAFLYDRNGFLIENLPANFKIILLNNSGGSIFRMIEGPRAQPELLRLFETQHAFTAERTAADANVGYWSAASWEELTASWPVFSAHPHCGLLELHTDSATNQQIFDAMKRHIAE